MSSPARSSRSSHSSHSSSAQHNTETLSVPCTPPRTPSPSSPTTPIYDRFTDPFRSLPPASTAATTTAGSSVNTTPTPATPRMGRMPSTPSFVPFAPARRGSLGGGPYGVRTPQPRTPETRGRYEVCGFANCSTFSVDSDYSTAGESFYGDDGDDGEGGDSEDELVEHDDGSGNMNKESRKAKHASYATTASSSPSTPSSAGPVTPLWPAFEVTAPITPTTSSSSSSASCKRHSYMRSYTARRPSPPRPAPAPSLWTNNQVKSQQPACAELIYSPSPVRSYRFLPADMVPAKDLRQQPSAASSWFAKTSSASTTRSSFGDEQSICTHKLSRPLVRPSHPVPPAPYPFTSTTITTNRSTTATPPQTRSNAYIPSELSIFDPAPRHTLLADFEYIAGKKLHFPLLSRWSGEKKKGVKGVKECRARGSRDEKALYDRTSSSEGQRNKEALGKREERGSCESWREKYAKREYWI